jgi:hypothetical protein
MSFHSSEKFIETWPIFPYATRARACACHNITPYFERDVRAGRKPAVQLLVDATAMVQTGIGSSNDKAPVKIVSAKPVGCTAHVGETGVYDYHSRHAPLPVAERIGILRQLDAAISLSGEAERRFMPSQFDQVEAYLTNGKRGLFKQEKKK